MNPNSNYFLAFNTGYPNAYDRAWGHTGSELMVHSDCSSRGCYAMTDVQMQEIYALARESFFGGQKSFQLQAFPFRDFRVPMNETTGSPEVEMMHLHLVARRGYFTGELAYMAVRRAMGHGLRVIGTLKDGPDINVLALYEK